MRPFVLLAALFAASTSVAFGQVCPTQLDVDPDRRAAEQASTRGPDDPVAQATLAHVYSTLRLHEAARAIINRAIEIDGTNGYAYHVRASLSLRLGQLDEADRDTDLVLQYCANAPHGYLLKTAIMFARLDQDVRAGKRMLGQTALEPIIAVLKVGVEKTKGHRDHGPLRSDLDGVSAFYQYFANGTVSTGPDTGPGVTPLRYLSQPRPGYTDAARLANVQGTARLMVLFGASGKVEGVLALNRLGGDLEKQAVIAASKITFEPMQRDGKPVSTIKMVAYTFSIY